MVEVCNFNYSIFIPEDVRRFDISVNDMLLIMEIVKALTNLLEHTFYLTRFKLNPAFLLVSQLKEIVPGLVHLYVHLEVLFCRVRMAEVA